MFLATNQRSLVVVVCVIMCGCSNGAGLPSPPTSTSLPATSPPTSTVETSLPMPEPVVSEPVVPESPGIATPSEETNDSGEKPRAEEMLAVAAAKARAFSQRVRNMQTQFSEVYSKQFANQTLRDTYLPQSRRRRPEVGSGRGLGANARQAGDAAGQEQLLDEEKKLNSESELVQRRFETVLQEESWKRLAPSERDLIAKYDLIPKEVRDSVRVEAPAAIGSVLLPNQIAETKTEPPESWQVVSLEGTSYELAFPGKPEIQRERDSIAYVCRDRDRAFVFRRFITNHVPDDLAIEDVLQAQTTTAVESSSQKGIAAAVRTARLADLPAREVCNYFVKGGLERSHLNRVTLIEREIVVVEVLNIEVSDELVVRQFFDSFRRRMIASEK